MLLDHHFYWKSKDKNKDGVSASYHLVTTMKPLPKFRGTYFYQYGCKLRRGRLFTTERTMKMAKEDGLLIVQNNKNKIQNPILLYAQTNKIK